MTARRWVLVAALVAALAVAVAALQALSAPPAALDRARQGTAETAPGGVQTVELVAAGGVYTPNVVHVRAGVPLKLRVTVRERHGCQTRLLVPDLGVDLELVPGATAEVLVESPPPGAHLFTCGQKMVKGTIVVE